MTGGKTFRLWVYYSYMKKINNFHPFASKQNLWKKRVVVTGQERLPLGNTADSYWNNQLLKKVVQTI